MDLKTLVRAQAPDAKAITSFPALTAPGVPVVYREGQRKQQSFRQREAHQHLAAYGGHEAIDWVMNATRLIVETAGSAAYRFESRDGKRLLNQRNPLLPSEPVADPLLVKLFERPNPYMDWAEFVELTLIDYLLVGNAYWLRYRPYGDNDSRPLALYRLAPPYVSVIPGQYGVEGFEYQPPGQRDPLKLPANAVMHFKQANPHNPYLGLGLVKGGARMLDMEIALTDTTATYFEKQATPSLVVTSDRRVPTDVFNKLKQQIRAFYGGSKNSGEIMVLEAGLKATSISPSAHEAAFEVLSKLSRDRILSLLRVPPALLGVSGSSNEKINDAQRIFDTKTMRPLLDKFQAAITGGLTRPGWDVDFKIDYEYIMPPEDRLKLVTSFAAIPGVRLKEVREYAGLEPLGDERDDLVLNLPGENGTEEDHDAGFADRPLGSEGGRPPKGKNTKVFPEPGGALPKDAQARRAQKAPLPVDDVLARMREIEAKAPTSGAVKLEREGRDDIDSRIEKPQDHLRSEREEELDALAVELKAELSDAAHYLERSLLDHVEGKAGDSIYQRIKNSAAWQTFTERIQDAIERISARAIQRAVMHEGRQGRRPEGEIDYAAIARDLVNSGHTPSDIAGTLRDSIAEKVLGAQRSGLPRADFEALIREAISTWTDSNAEAAALDTGTEAYNMGTLTVAEMVGRTHVDVFDGDEHDEPCAEANGQTWEIEYAKQHLKQHPRCRRAFSPA